MKKFLPFILLLSVLAACNKEEAPLETAEEQEDPDIPQLVEAELLEVASKDWNTLRYKLWYFEQNILSKGKLKGYGPDSVYYALDFKLQKYYLNANFSVADSTWVSAYGRVNPLSIHICANSTSLYLEFPDRDSATLYLNSNMSFRVPLDFKDSTCVMYYEGQKVGYVDIEEFETEEYSTYNNIVLHYYDDPRTFTFYDSGTLTYYVERYVDFTSKIEQILSDYEDCKVFKELQEALEDAQ